MLEGRCRAVSLRVKTWWVGDVGVTSLEDIVGVRSWHDPVAAHLIEGVLADGRCWSRVGSSNANSEAHLTV